MIYILSLRSYATYMNHVYEHLLQECANIINYIVDEDVNTVNDVWMRRAGRSSLSEVS